MRTLGIRVEPKCVHYSIVEGDESTVTLRTIDSLIVPLALDIPRSLSFIRTSLISIIQEFEITQAGIRVYEGNTQNLDKFRMNVEGVIQELFANSTVDKYVCATKHTLAGLLETDVAEITDLIEGNENHFQIINWDALHKNEREAVITAVATLYI